MLLHSKVLVVTVTAGAILLGLLAALAPGWLAEIDMPISEAARATDDGGFWEGLSLLGSPNTAVALSVVVVASMWRRCKALAMTYPVMVGLAIVSDVVLKLVVDRARPDAPLVGTNLGSFPSGHVIMAVVMLGFLPPVVWIVTQRRWAFWASVAVLGAGLPAVIASRVVLGAHWPSDVLASLFIGSSLLLIGEYFVGSGWASVHCGSCALHLEDDSADDPLELPAGV